MRVYRFDNHGGLDGLHIHDEPVPSPQRGELLLRITAVLLNYRDIAIPLGRHPGHHERASRPTLRRTQKSYADGLSQAVPAVGQRSESHIDVINDINFGNRRKVRSATRPRAPTLPLTNVTILC
jgi:hypothetical protein